VSTQHIAAAVAYTADRQRDPRTVLPFASIGGIPWTGENTPRDFFS
jgi:hypothetical protein